jgi:hydroxymethylpyrimidine pyrophosphatase-like HAD family hydrolase
MAREGKGVWPLPGALSTPKMRTVMAARSPILLISTDFDGTLVEHGNPAPFAPLLVEVLHVLRRHGVRWAINTGRTMPMLEEAMETFALPIQPDFALTSEREIFRPAPAGNGGWEDFGDWNERCARVHREFFAAAAPVLEEVLAFVQAETGARVIYDHQARGAAGVPELAGLVAQDEPEMDAIVRFLETLKARLPDLGYQRNTIYLRFCHAGYDKGVTLSELGRLIDVPPEARFAVGDHHNDIPMLNGVHAHHVACPSNSVGDVKQVVADAGGYVAAGGYSTGVIEALRYYCAELGL